MACVAATTGANVERAAAVLEVDTHPADEAQTTFREDNKEEAVDPALRSFKESLQHHRGGTGDT